MSYIYGSPNPLTNNLVMWFDAANPKSMVNQTLGTWSDISGRGVTNSIASFGTPVYSAANGGSLVFNGVNTYYRLPSGNGILPLLNISIDIWFRITRDEIRSSYHAALLSITYGIIMTIYNSKIYFRIYNSTIEQAVVVSTINLVDDMWHNIVITVDDTNLILYVDGKYNNMRTPSMWDGTTSSVNIASFIGNNANDPNDCVFKGNISTLRIYNIVLTPSQVLKNYNSTCGRYYITYPLVNMYLDALTTNSINKNLRYENVTLNTSLLRFLGTTSNSATFLFGTQSLDPQSLLRRTAFILTPTVYKENILANIVDTSISSVFTYSRTSTSATRINSQGFIENVPYNLLQQSEDFTSSTWISLGSPTVIRTANIEVAPNGTLTADRIVSATSSNDRGIRQQVISSTIFNAALTYSFSVWAKSDNNAVMSLDISDITPITFTLSNTWNRYTVTSKGNPLYNNNSAFCDITFLSNQLGKSIYLWGAQLELGTVATTYFPTTTRQNVPRINYNGLTPSILIEPTRTNTLLFSEAFTQSAWTYSNMIITINNAISPNNAMGASTFLATADNATLLQHSQTSLQNAPRVFSIYLKRKTGNGTISLTLAKNVLSTTISSTWSRYVLKADNIFGSYSAITGLHTVTTDLPHGFTASDRINFFPFSGTSVGNGSLGFILTVNIVDQYTFTFSNGTYNTSGTCTTVAMTPRLIMSTNNDEIYAWGAQLECDSTNIGNNYRNMIKNMETTYIPTYNTISTRQVDIVTTPIQRNIYFTQSYCLYNEYSINDFTFTSLGIAAFISFGRGLLFYSTIKPTVSSSTNSRIYITHCDQANNRSIPFTTLDYPLNTIFKTILKRDSSNNMFSYFINGSFRGTYSPTGSSDLAFDRVTFENASGIGGGDVSANIHRSYMVQSLLTDAQCIELTR